MALFFGLLTEDNVRLVYRSPNPLGFQENIKFQPICSNCLLNIKTKFSGPSPEVIPFQLKGFIILSFYKQPKNKYCTY